VSLQIGRRLSQLFLEALSHCLPPRWVSPIEAAASDCTTNPVGAAVHEIFRARSFRPAPAPELRPESHRDAGEPSERDGRLPESQQVARDKAESRTGEERSAGDHRETAPHQRRPRIRDGPASETAHSETGPIGHRPDRTRPASGAVPLRDGPHRT
jgi:hypothetical protein